MDGTSERLLTPGEVATLFRVDPKTVTRWALVPYSAVELRLRAKGRTKATGEVNLDDGICLSCDDCHDARQRHVQGTGQVRFMVLRDYHVRRSEQVSRQEQRGIV